MALKLRPEELIVITFGVILFGFRWSVGIVGIPFRMSFDVILTLVLLLPHLLVISWMVSGLVFLADSKVRNVSIRGIPSFLRDFFPFFAVIILYESLNLPDGRDLIHMVNPVDLDFYLIKVDQLLFGVQASLLTQGFTSSFLTDFMWVAYSLHFLLPVVLGFVLYWDEYNSGFRNFILAIVLADCVGYVCYFIVPAVGPELNLEYTTVLSGGLATDFASATEEMLTSTHRNAFPSLHVALSAVVLLFAYKYSKKAFYLLLIPVISLWVSCVYLRQHYLIDIIAGWLLALACFHASPKINDWWSRHWFKPKVA